MASKRKEDAVVEELLSKLIMRCIRERYNPDQLSIYTDGVQDVLEVLSNVSREIELSKFSEGIDGFLDSLIESNGSDDDYREVGE